METSATWSISITVKSKRDGLHIEVSDNAAPVFGRLEHEGDCGIDLEALHKSYLPSHIEVTEVIRSLQSVLEGAWEYSSPGGIAYCPSNPIFTVNGDVLMQLGVTATNYHVNNKNGRTTVNGQEVVNVQPSVFASPHLSIPASEFQCFRVSF